MKKLFGIPVVEDDRLDPDEAAVYPLERTCKCQPAEIVRLVLSPVVGVQCDCGAVWPLKEPEVGDEPFR